MLLCKLTFEGRHPEEIDAMEEDDEAPSRLSMPSLPDRGVNGTR
jgi:hypothetical protein